MAFSQTFILELTLQGSVNQLIEDWLTRRGTKLINGNGQHFIEPALRWYKKVRQAGTRRCQ